MNNLAGEGGELRMVVTVTNPGEPPQTVEFVGKVTDGETDKKLRELINQQEKDHGRNSLDRSA